VVSIEWFVWCILRDKIWIDVGVVTFLLWYPLVVINNYVNRNRNRWPNEVWRSIRKNSNKSKVEMMKYQFVEWFLALVPVTIVMRLFLRAKLICLTITIMRPLVCVCFEWKEDRKVLELYMLTVMCVILVQVTRRISQWGIDNVNMWIVMLIYMIGVCDIDYGGGVINILVNGAIWIIIKISQVLVGVRANVKWAKFVFWVSNNNNKWERLKKREFWGEDKVIRKKIYEWQEIVNEEQKKREEIMEIFKKSK